MLFYGNGFCGCWYSGSLLKDITFILPTANLQLRLIMPPVIWNCTLPPTSCPEVGIEFLVYDGEPISQLQFTGLTPKAISYILQKRFSWSLLRSLQHSS